MSQKSTTKESYQATAVEFAQKVAELLPLESIEKFTAMLPAHAKILDIGCGSGRDAKAFSERGLHVVGIDFCTNLLSIAKSEAPSAEFYEMDIEEMHFPDKSFDGAWAAASLLHLPKKAMNGVLRTIHVLLKDGGKLYLSLKKGSGEALEKDLRYGGAHEKFSSYFEEAELKELLLAANFTILEMVMIDKKHPYQTHPFLRVFAQKSK